MKHKAEQFGLFAEADLQNAAAKEVWKKREVDRLLDFYLSGADLGRIAASLQRNRKAVVRKVQEYIYNERERVTNYIPRQRTSRAGKRLTQNERQILTECRKRKVSDTQIAAVLARPLKDLATEAPLEKLKTKSATPFAPTLDLILAYRYIFHIYKKRIISDETYDSLKAEEQEYGPKTFALANEPRKCPTYIKSLAVYLTERHEYQRDNKS